MKSTISNLQLDGHTFEDREVALKEDNSIMKGDDVCNPSTSFRSFEQRFGEISVLPPNRVRSTARSKAIAFESPASSETNLSVGNEISLPIAIGKEHKDSMRAKLRKKLRKQRSLPSDIDRDEAWERKRNLYRMKEDKLSSKEKHTDESFGSESNSKLRTVGRSVSDCGDKTPPLPCRKSSSKTRTRSLTDEDLEELRGCIELGFGFSHTDGCDLRSTLPALDLYYAINRQYNDIKIRASPVSTIDAMTNERSSDNESSYSSLSDTWKISRPGDHPNQVKTRLRHWAQAVACSIRQGLLV